MEKHTVTFQPSGIKVEIASGSNLLNAASEAGVSINSLCGGEGVCGKCRVQIMRGRAQPNAHSIRYLSREEVQQNFVLACQTEVRDNLEVWVPPEARLEGEQIITTGSMVSYENPEEIHPDEATLPPATLTTPLTGKQFLQLPEPSLSDNISDLDRIYREMKKKLKIPYLETPLRSLRGLASLLRENQWEITATVHPVDENCSKLLFFEPKDTTARNFGMAVDIGTTTIAVQLVDLRTGNILGVEASHNQQAKYGEDVISRIIYACNRGGMCSLHETVVDTVNTLIDTLLERHKVGKEEVTVLCAAGNTTMTHLFLGLEPCTIRLEPYIPTANFFPVSAAAEINLHLHPDAIVACIPGVSSYVGGDITAGVLASGLSNSPRVAALIDIGTNGEIVVGNNEWLVCCSASAGPAFEGSGTKCGMRAARGAIQKLKIEDGRVRYETIGNARPRGLCGSGFIDTIAELFRCRIIDPNGKFIKNTRSPRFRVSEEVPEFILAFADETETGKDIVITEADISNLIKSKGAIMAAMQVLLSSVGLTPGDVEDIFVAGGFGNYLNVEEAVVIGLLPDVPRDRIRYIGNSSLTGARMAMLSRHAFARAKTLARQMTYLELSVNAEFMENFVASLFLPHTDLNLFPSVRKLIEAGSSCSGESGGSL